MASPSDPEADGSIPLQLFQMYFGRYMVLVGPLPTQCAIRPQITCICMQGDVGKREQHIEMATTKPGHVVVHEISTHRKDENRIIMKKVGIQRSTDRFILFACVYLCMVCACLHSSLYTFHTYMRSKHAPNCDLFLAC